MSFKYNYYFPKTLSAITEDKIAKQRRKNLYFLYLTLLSLL
jgi:hypothetical protein